MWFESFNISSLQLSSILGSAEALLLATHGVSVIERRSERKFLIWPMAGKYSAVYYVGTPEGIASAIKKKKKRMVTGTGCPRVFLLVSQPR